MRDHLLYTSDVKDIVHWNRDEGKNNNVIILFLYVGDGLRNILQRHDLFLSF